MRYFILMIVLFSSAFVSASQKPACPTWLNHSFTKLHSKEVVNLCEKTADKTLLIVNTASSCGFTPQFKGLEALNQKYKDQGLVVIGFPSDSFFQEHNDSEKTANVCYVNYGVTFLMLAESSVRGKKANAVFKHLNDTAGAPKWNFTKYLVGKDGKVLERFGSRVEPSDQKLREAIEAAL